MSAAAMASLREVQFAAGLPGLAPFTAFRLEPIADAAGLYALRSAGGEVRLFVLDAPDDYQPRLEPGVLAEVGAAEGDEVRVLVVANPADDGVYLNLRAPIIVHPETGRGAQVILDEQSYPIRVRLEA